MEYYWVRRLEALIVDIIILSLFMWILSILLFWISAGVGVFSVLNYWIYIAALIIIAYFTYMEGKTGSTFGKRLLNLKVEAKEGDMDYKKAFIRNLSKILYLPLIVDFILGYIFGESKDRILDKASGTYVVLAQEPESDDSQ